MSESGLNESEDNPNNEEVHLQSDAVNSDAVNSDSLSASADKVPFDKISFGEVAFENVSVGDFDLVDRFFANQLPEAEAKLLESKLANDSLLRTFFVRYSGFVSDLQMSAKASVAGENALQHVFGNQALDQSTSNSSSSLEKNNVHLKTGIPDLGNSRSSSAEQPESNRFSDSLRSNRFVSQRTFALAVVSAALLIGLALGFLIPTKRATSPEPIAWLVNAHDCQWANGFSPSANMQADDFVKLESGLVQIRFSSGVDVLIEGPAELMLISDMSAKLNRGKVSVKVPNAMKGFEIFSPQGRVLDLGTEFGVTVSDDGVTDVLVFDGEVETFVGDDRSKPIKLLENQSASISNSEINTEKSVDNNFVRKISDAGNQRFAEKKLSKTSFVFDGSIQDGILDQNGRPIGFRTRLPGTGESLPQKDSNLNVDFQSKLLRLTTTRSDINRQARLATGEYFGFKLSEFGFTGREDFSVTVEIPNIPNLENFGQVGLYCGVKSDQVIRGGFIKWGQAGPAPNTIFMVNNNGGDDSDSNKVGLLNAGIDLQLTLSRINNKYSLTAENLTDGGSASLSIRHPKHLDNQTDVHVGVFGANPFSDVRKTVNIKKFTIKVWK